MSYVIGIDYGSDSVRAILIKAEDGQEIAQHTHYYQRWKEGKYCDPTRNQFRQHPLDYLEGLEATVKGCLSQAKNVMPEQIKGIAVDTTGSTPVAVDQSGTPLAMLPGFEENPNAMFILWKDHTAIQEAEEINHISRTWGGTDYTKYIGGIYSSEWFWAKILHTIREDDAVASAAYSWLEHCDWIPAVLTGVTDVHQIKRSRCAAGHKAMWHEEWEGLPPKAYLTLFDARLADLRDRLFRHTYTADIPAGKLTKAWADQLGLTPNTTVAVGTFDAHAGGVGGEIEPYSLVKVMGTSTCDIMVAPFEEIGDKLVKGICGQVDGSVIPGMLGLEAGQSAFGDVLAWFKKVLLWPTQNNPNLSDAIKEKIAEDLIPQLSLAAAELPLDVEAIVALDWINGRRTPDANQVLKGAIMGMNMGSNAPAIFKALVESICFGSKRIVDRFRAEGVTIKQVVGLGGVAKKSPFVMQTLADVLDMPIKVASSDQAPSLGAAMYAATAAGIYPNVNEARKHMGNGFDKTYYPIPENVETYSALYTKYITFGQFVEDNS